MMFATLDDLEGQVEMFVFATPPARPAEALEADRVVLVRGRVDHKERGETKPRRPGGRALRARRATSSRRRAAKAERRAPEPLVLRIDAADFAPTLIEELKAVFENFPGESEVLLEMQTREGTRRLRFGADYRVAPSPALRAELDELLGPAALAA